MIRSICTILKRIRFRLKMRNPWHDNDIILSKIQIGSLKKKSCCKTLYIVIKKTRKEAAITVY